METIVAPLPIKVDRTRFLGGSDAAGVLGLSRWETPLSIWSKKVGRLQESEEESLPMKLGKKLEPIIGELFTDATGLKIRRANEHRIHPQHSFLAAQIDFMVVGEDAVCECKSASGWKAKEWKDEEIPQEYIIQGMHQLAITGKQKCYVAVLIGGNQDFKVKEVLRDEALIEQMIAREVEFWNEFVIPKVMPGTITKNDGGTLYQLFPSAEEASQIDLGDDGVRLVESRNALYADQISIEGHIEKIENEIKALLKDKEIGLAGKWQVSWKPQVTKRLDTKAFKVAMPALFDKYSKESPSRVFRVKEINNHGDN